MTRVLSALALLPFVLGTILFLPPVATVVLAEVVALLAFVEYTGLARAAGIRFPTVSTGAATLATVAAIALTPTALPVVIMAAVLVVALTALADEGGEGALASVGAAGFAVLYLGVTVGALAAVQMQAGRESLVVLLATVMVSDTAQYYGGRWLGRRPLAPSLSPKKTIEGAVCGVAAAGAVMAAIGPWGAPGIGTMGHVALGATLAMLGIAGDLFESRLKRSSGVKDASALIPGHGGVLDRVDALLFAAPVYYTVVVFVGSGPS